MTIASLELIRLQGVRVSLDASWYLFAPLLVAALALGVFPMLVPEVSRSDYLIMALCGAAGLALSLLAQAVVHLQAARRLGVAVHEVRLTPLGAVAIWPVPRSGGGRELLLAAVLLFYGVVAGALVLFLFFRLAGAETPLIAGGVAVALGMYNLALGLVVLVPLYPLGAGRALMAWLLRRPGTATTRANA